MVVFVSLVFFCFGDGKQGMLTCSVIYKSIRKFKSTVDEGLTVCAIVVRFFNLRMCSPVCPVNNSTRWDYFSFRSLYLQERFSFPHTNNREMQKFRRKNPRYHTKYTCTHHILWLWHHPYTTVEAYWLATSKVTALGSSRFVLVTLTTPVPSIFIFTMTSFPVSE